MGSTSPYPGLKMHSCGFWGRENEFPCRMWLLVGQLHIWRMAPHPVVPGQHKLQRAHRNRGRHGEGNLGGVKREIGANVIKMCCIKFSIN